MKNKNIAIWTTNIFRNGWKQPIFDEDGNFYIPMKSKEMPISKKLLWICRYPEKLKLGKASIGSFTTMNAKHGIEIQDFVQLGSHCSIYSVTTHWKGDTGKVLIKRNARIGDNVMIMPGVTIGRNTIIGAFSFVNKDIPDNVLAYGIPIKIKRKLNTDEIFQLEDSIVHLKPSLEC
jgi:acetyltransferase-like isoleucine patch superfamily enzyme